MKVAAIVAATAVCLAALAPLANAVERLDTTNAAGVCQSALPRFDANFATRPSGIANIGTTSAFVTCSTTQNFLNSFSANAASELHVLLTNPTAAPLTVNCTMVEGLLIYTEGSADPRPAQFPKSFVIPAGETVEGVWSAAEDNGGTPFMASLNLTCGLPAGAEIGTVGWYSADDGTAPAGAQ